MSPSDPPSPIRVEPVLTNGDLASALAIREVVFIEEQHVPPSLEHDAEDSSAFHVLAYEGKHAIGTGRLVARVEPPPGETGEWGRVGRMAVLAAHRRRKVGSLILDALEAEARSRKLSGIVLHAQLHAREFYLGAGYAATGPIFVEAGMPHVQMLKWLSNAVST